jgi:4-amino-4-deoxy-L-arabinose transferase-like glycosyltransferase
MIIGKKWSWVILSLLLWIIIFEFIPNGFYDLGGDSAQYIILSEGINQGKWFKAINFPGEPFYFYYPPVFPLLLYPIVRFFGRNFFLMRFLVAMLGYLSLFFLYKLFKEYIDEKIAFFITTVLAINWVFIYYSTGPILSDVPYLFISSFTLLSGSRYLKSGNVLNRQGLLLILGLILSYFTRYIGITLFLGIVTVFLLSAQKDRTRKLSLIGFGFFVAFLLWQLATNLISSPASGLHSNQILLVNPYQPFLSNVINHPGYLFVRFIQGANYYYLLIGQSLSFNLLDRWKLLAEIFYFTSFLFIFLGFCLEFRKDKACMFQYYFLLYFILIILWPFREGVRFVLPILPFLFFYFFSGAMYIFSSIGRRFFLPGVSFIVCMFFIFNTLNLFYIFKSAPSDFKNIPKEGQNFIDLHNWIKSNLKDSGFIISRKPTITYFYTGHKAFCYPFTLNPHQLWQFVVKNNFKYIIVDEFSQETYYYLTPCLYRYKDRLKFLHSFGNTSIFQVIDNKLR